MTKDDKKSHKKESLMTIFFSTSKPQQTKKSPIKNISSQKKKYHKKDP
jgi:hypothetical protein